MQLPDQASEDRAIPAFDIGGRVRLRASEPVQDNDALGLDDRRCLVGAVKGDEGLAKQFELRWCELLIAHLVVGQHRLPEAPSTG
ncbi:MAG TPA: hypothetical protein VHF24_02800 [Acidimicrobiales bacterium]|nr:hypothetical protein [Acidimicrobiales bacterium]